MRKLGGLAMVCFCALTWAWMLGVLAHTGLGRTLTGVAAQWLAPGILAVPAFLSVLIGLVGLLLLVGIIAEDAEPR